MTPGGFIEVEGHTYNRHDVFEEIENTEFPKRLSYHKQIWERPNILGMLETNMTDVRALRDEFTPFWKNKDFDIFFSPYFAGPFAYLSRNFLTEKDMWSMGVLLGYEDFLQADEREEAFRPIRLFFDENTRILRNVNGDNYSIMRPQILHWIEKDWYPLFNNLPPEFYEQKHDITLMIINIGVSVQKSYRKDCKKTSEQLISLQDTPDGLRDTIVSNHAIYTGSGGSGGGSWRGAWWIVWIVIGIIRAFSSDSCNGSSNNKYKYNYDFPTLKYQIPDTTFKGLVLDSVNKRDKGYFDSLSKSFKPMKISTKPKVRRRDSL